MRVGALQTDRDQGMAMRLVLDLFDICQRPITAEVIIRRNTVELRCREHLVGVADRDYLHNWLTAPFGVYAYDDVTWLPIDSGIALFVGDIVSGHILSAAVVANLRDHL